MNLNFHIVDIPACLAMPEGLETAARSAVNVAGLDDVGLRSLAELVDWELATCTVRSMLAERCERALRRHVVRFGLTPGLRELSETSSIVAALVALTRDEAGAEAA